MHDPTYPNTLKRLKFRSELKGDDQYPLLNQLRGIIFGSHLNASLLAASLRPETKIAIKEFCQFMGGLNEIAIRWYEILHWVRDQLNMGTQIDRELRDMLIGLAAVIKMKGLKVG